MKNSFLDQIILTLRTLLCIFALMLIASNFYYGASQIIWIRTLMVLAIVVITFFYKPKQLIKKSKDFDERSQFIYYRALSVGFYCLMVSILWFLAREISLELNVSTRTCTELAFGVLGYTFALSYLKKKY